MSGSGGLRDWIPLTAGSAALSLLLDIVGLPAAWLLGPMVVAMAMAAAGRSLVLPSALSTASQALIGCLIANAITPGVLVTLSRDWALLLTVSAATIAASALLGSLLARWRVVPPAVAIWGSSPGGATAMVIMAEAWGADARLVAVMVYLRVVMVVCLASLIAMAFAGNVAHRPLVADWSTALNARSLALTAGVAVSAVLLGRRLKLPAGALICAMAIGAALNLTGVARVEPPPLLLIPAYVAIGWRLGLGFDRRAVAASARALPRLALVGAILLGFGGLMAWALVRFAGVDPLDAYLATSPGGMDAIAVIAATSPADAPFVMAFQVVRFLMSMSIGPVLAIYLSKRAARDLDP